MTQIPLLIELLSDVVLPSTSATVGAPVTQTLVSGNQLRGVVGQHYTSFGDDAWDVFHSGAVRFRDGLPITPHDVTAVPMPLCLHHPKGVAPFGNNGQLQIVDDVVDASERPAAMRHEQLRVGYLTDTGHWHRPARRAALRTAIDPSDQRAREGFLFGLEALTRGQRFLAVVEAEPSVPKPVVRSIVDILKGEHRIGRSRSAEFGRVRISRDGADTLWERFQRILEPAEDGCQLLFLSDVALRDPDTGAPTLQPTASTLALPKGASVNLGRSFVRSRRFSPFHGLWRRPRMEQQVLAAGSVLRVEGIQQAELIAAVRSGIGEYRSEGFGRVAVAPRLLARQWLPVPQSVDSTDAFSAPTGELMDWLVARRRLEDRRVAILDWVDETLVELRRYGAMNRSQWGLVRQQAASAVNKVQLMERLRHLTREQGASGTRAGWGRRHGGQTRGASFIQRVASLNRDADASEAVQLLALRRMRDLAEGE